MFDRPRCRDWSPLSTQQLRLRSLIQISGHNIRCEPQKCSVYFTLHTTTMSAPFYTSEKLDIHNNIIWPEINCRTLVKSSLRCVCVRVWQHPRDSTDQQQQQQVPAVAAGDDCVAQPVQEGDKQLFLWGVYFSGLVPLSRRSEKRLKENTLVFQMHGGFFTSAEHILDGDEQRSAGAASTAGLLADKTDLLCDTSNNSTPGWYSLNALTSVEGRTAKGASFGGASSSSSKSCSERAAATEFQSSSSFPADRTATVSPTPTEPETNLKIRYLFMEFLRSEIRPCYDVPRLLAVQERQRRIKYESESAKELTDRICMKSAYCLNLDLFTDKNQLVVYHSSSAVAAHQNRGGMGRQLSRLLYQEREPLKPEILLKAQELRRQIELARFRSRILLQEKERIRGSIRQLQQKLNQITDANIETESALMANYRSYGREKEGLYQQKLAYASEKETYRELKTKVLAARHRLLRGLNEIYCIKKTSNGSFTINDVPLPNAESYTDATPALALSVALGYVAHVVLMCSSVLNIPLRNPIKYEGSRSKMIDCIKVLPTADREFPLYCRSGPPTNALLYSVFLLNQNISQLKYYLCLSRGDPRATLANLHDILHVPSINVLSRDIEEPFQSIQSSSEASDATRPDDTADGHHNHHHQSGMSGSSSVELDVPIAFNQLAAVTALKESKSASRISRSVDTYGDDHPVRDTTEKRRNGKFASDPILAQGQLQVTGFDKNKNF